MNTDLVPAPAPENPQALVPLDPFRGKRAIAVFMDQDTPERVAQLGRAVQVDGTNWPDEPTVVEAVGITCWQRRVSKSDEPEKVSTYVAVHAKDGSNWITASELVLDALPQVAAGIGRQPPWPEGQIVTIGKKHKVKGDLGRCWIAAGDVTILPNA